MKKTFLAFAVAAVALNAGAQAPKTGLLAGYTEGEDLEKTVYQSKEDEVTLDVWAGAFASKPSAVPSPKIGKELSYTGYPEKGPSIIMGTPEGVKGSRFSVYPIDTKKSYSKGVLYLACVIEMSKTSSKSAVDVLGLSAATNRASNRAAIKVLREGGDRIKFATNILKSQAETTMAYDYDTPHLVILKIDYDNQTATLYVDPTNTEAEPTEADCVAHGDEENVLKHAIRSISLRTRSGNNGYVGNIRLTRTWAELFSE